MSVNTHNSWYKTSEINDFMRQEEDFWGIDVDKDGTSSFLGLPYSGTQCTGFACGIRQRLGSDRVKIFWFPN